MGTVQYQVFAFSGISTIGANFQFIVTKQKNAK
jgi:hypothetical protein